MTISCLSSLLMLIPCTLPVHECFLSFKSIQLFYYHVSLLIKMYKSMLNGDYSVCLSVRNAIFPSASRRHDPGHRPLGFLE